jgi:ribonucleoside-diphosphate reductase beta chain
MMDSAQTHLLNIWYGTSIIIPSKYLQVDKSDSVCYFVVSPHSQQGAAMTPTLFSIEWIEASAHAINHHAAYRKAASNWRWPLLLQITHDDTRITAIYLDLYHGNCRAARIATPVDMTQAEFVLEANEAIWRQVLTGQLDPIAGIMRRQLTLTKGSLTILAMHGATAKALIAAISQPNLPDVPAPSMPNPLPASPVQHQSFVTTSRQGLNNDSVPMRLWHKAKRLGVWNPADIDFSQDIADWQGLNAMERDLLLRLTGMFVAGEESVTLDLLPLIMTIAREGRLEEEMFLTTFLWEEAKHVDFFANGFLKHIAPDAGDLSHYHTPAYRTLFYDELPSAMHALNTDSSPVAQARASATYNMIVEGVLAETGYEAYFAALERNNLMPGVRQGILYLKRDESRHIAYGVYLLSRLIAADPQVWPVIEQRMNQLMPVAMQIITEIFSAYDEMPFGLTFEEFSHIAMTNFSRRMQRIEKARFQQDNEEFDEGDE